MVEGQQFIVNHTDEYKRYKETMEQADIEQKEIDAEILEFHKLVQELKEQGYSEAEADEIVREKYKDE